MTQKNIANDKELIQGCLKNDATCQKKLYDKYAATMYTICLRYGQHQEEAKDFLQDGFVKVFKSLASFAFKGSFEGWMKRIFVNTALEEIRKKGRLVLQEEPDTSHLIEEEWTVSSNLTMNHILAEIQKLPDGYRTIFNLYVIDGFQHNEIAELLGISDSTSKTQLRKARMALQQKLQHLRSN